MMTVEDMQRLLVKIREQEQGRPEGEQAIDKTMYEEVVDLPQGAEETVLMRLRRRVVNGVQKVHQRQLFGRR